MTEFGTCAYSGAADRGGMAWAVLDQDAESPRLTEQLIRDEGEQVRYLTDLLTIFSEESVDAAFWFTLQPVRMELRAFATWYATGVAVSRQVAAVAAAFLAFIKAVIVTGAAVLAAMALEAALPE